jgi:hypothetical protein
MNGSSAAFKWDKYGINALYTETINNVSTTGFVRFDKYGIYGIKNNSTSWLPEDMNSISQHATFALTWKGL